MIGDIISIKSHYLIPAQKITELIRPKMKAAGSIFALTVGGESGSGKSTLSVAIKSLLSKEGLNAFIFHIDDYFYLPPRDTQEQRLKDISCVGLGEVNLALLQEHIDKVKNGVKLLKKPLVYYRENQIHEVMVDLSHVDVVIAEGTYASLLDHIDCRILMLRDYKDTYEARVHRARDPIIAFNEEVLEIEHGIVKKHIPLADVLVDKEYNVRINSTRFKEEPVYKNRRVKNSNNKVLPAVNRPQTGTKSSGEKF